MPENKPDAKLTVTRIAVPKASDVLAGRLRDAILEGRVAFGSSLPSERDLMAQSGLSRTSVREALRILELQGLIETRAGRNGGSYVRRPGSETVTRSLDLLIQGQSIGLEDLVAAREAIEPVAAAQAALRRTPQELERLAHLTRRCEDDLSDIRAFLQSNLDWHLAVVEASHNRLFIALVTSIAPAIHAASGAQELTSQSVRQLVVQAHQRVFAAIEAGDAEAARRRMDRHVAAYAEQARGIEPARLEGVAG